MLMGTNRKEVKQQFFKAVLFSKKRVFGKDKAMAQVFQREFPSVYRFFTALKQLTVHDLPELKDIIKEKRTKFYSSSNAYKILSAALQRLESRIVTQHIAAKMIDTGIGPFLTVHDSFMVLPQYQVAAVKIIEDTFKSFQIEPPSLSIETL